MARNIRAKACFTCAVCCSDTIPRELCLVLPLTRFIYTWQISFDALYLCMLIPAGARWRQIPVTRVLVLVPTRELGVQVYQVTRQLSQFLPDMHVALAAGGMDIKVQASAGALPGMAPRLMFVVVHSGNGASE